MQLTDCFFWAFLIDAFFAVKTLADTVNDHGFVRGEYLLSLIWHLFLESLQAEKQVSLFALEPWHSYLSRRTDNVKFCRSTGSAGLAPLAFRAVKLSTGPHYKAATPLHL
jgi:hypothetical protein